MYQRLIDWFNQAYGNVQVGGADWLPWLGDKLTKGLDIAYKFQNAWLWLLTAIGVVAGMFIDTTDWLTTLMDHVGLTGLDVPSQVFGKTVSFSSAYGFLDAIFPFHEVISCITLLLPLWLAVNVLRLLRGVISLIQVNGWGFNN